MPDFIESLQGRDIGHLHIIAELWGIDLTEQEISAALIHLQSIVSNANLIQPIFDRLSPEVKAALSELTAHSGRLPWAQYTRRYGEVREMGVAKRDRERPYLQPISVAEQLWYCGFVATAFFDAPSGPEEYAYIPSDLLAQLPHNVEVGEPVTGRQASGAEYVEPSPANDRILDHACTLLAALRLVKPLLSPFGYPAGEELTPLILASLLSSAGLLDESGMPSPEPVRMFLESGRGEALQQLYKAWKRSSSFNELRFLPDLEMEGNWKNDPVRTREIIIGYLMRLPSQTWWSMDSFVAAIKQRDPDFQRTGGEYDAWFIHDRRTGEYLRGFKHWDAVDGRMIRYIITGPLYWLGLVDLGRGEADPEVAAFRLSRYSAALLEEKAPNNLPREEEPLIVRSDARVGARRLVPRRVRYQLARFCEWVKETPDEYQYQVTPASLAAARQQGLTVGQLLTLFTKSAKAVPPSLVTALERWDRHGSEARLEQLVILRVTSIEVLQAVKRSRASRFLGEPIGPTAIIIKPGAAQKVMAVLAELGYLGEIRGDIEGS